MKTVSLVLTLLHLLLAPLTADAVLVGQITVAGYGPEKPVIEDLARAFERAHPGVAVDVQWNRNLRAVDLVRSGRAQVAVADAPDAELAATQIAWDGIALVVNFTNQIENISRPEAADLLTGTIRRWSALDGPDRVVHLIMRPRDRNVDAGLRERLGINGATPPDAETVTSDQRALSKVSGDDRAITYMSLKAALAAVRDGIPIRILLVDRVEPEEPTVRNGRYQLRRPVLLLTPREPDVVTRAFLDFSRSADGERLIREMYVPAAEDSGLTDAPPRGFSESSNGGGVRARGNNPAVPGPG